MHDQHLLQDALVLHFSPSCVLSPMISVCRVMSLKVFGESSKGSVRVSTPEVIPDRAGQTLGADARDLCTKVSSGVKWGEGRTSFFEDSRLWLGWYLVQV